MGPRANAYWRRWRWHIVQHHRLAGGLWPPFFLNLVWFFYRRLYREIWVLVAIALVVVILELSLEELYFMWQGSDTQGIRYINTLGNLSVAFATSYAGSALYLRKLRRAVLEARSMEGTDEMREEFLRRRGGTNALAAAAGVVITLAMLGAFLAMDG